MIHSNISLIGFMGSGKTTVGKILAKKLDYRFIDVDKIIEYIEARKIREIFHDNGERYFRGIEKKVINKIYQNSKCVFACGGGAFEDDENIRTIKEKSYVIFLYESFHVAYKRLKRCKDRPLLNVEDPEKRIKDLLEKRDPVYSENSDLRVVTDHKKPGDVLDEIIAKLNLR
jgi:shikimate kinase